MIPKVKLCDGNTMPVLGLGTWQMEEGTCLNAIPTALKLGYRMIDTAYAYYNEKFVGEAIKGFPRDQLFLTTKLWREFHDPKRVEELCDKSMKDLQTDFLDLYLIHWPEIANMVDILGEMKRLQEKGKIKSFGVCNANIAHLKEVIRQGIQISMNQVEYHPFLNQNKLLEFCKDNEIAVTAYSPIIQGAVSNELALIEIGHKYKKTPAQISLRWLIQKGLIVIPKASTDAHLRENLDVFDFQLTGEDVQRIEKLGKIQRTIFPEFNEFHL